jgi:glycine/D-amino acid oxidase-like deaminating enzyme
VRSLWLDEPYRPRPPLRGRAEADVAVVGGGVMGASAAWALAGQGLTVAMLEADVLAGRASGRNAGFVLTSLAENYASMAARKGRAFARDVWGVNQENRERVAGLVRELGIDCGFARPGSYCAAADAAEAEQLRRSAGLLRADGFDFAFLEPVEARARLGRPGQHGALFRPGDGQIQPARFTRGLAARAEREGVRVHEGSRVARLAREGSAWALQGDGFALRAPQVIVAANALAPALHTWFASRLKPVRGQVLATAPVPGLRVPGPVYADHGYDYWRAHEGRLVVGGRRPVARGEEVGTEEALHPRVQAALEALARELAQRPVQVTHRWAGIMDFSLDGFPFVGPVPGEPGLLTAVGFTGHGFGYASVAADWLAARVLHGKDEVPAPFRTERAVEPDPRLLEG